MRCGENLFECASGAQDRGDIPRFGDTFLFRIPHPQHRHLARSRTPQRGKTRWCRAIWVGKFEDPTDNLPVTDTKLTRARSVKRLTEKNQCDRTLESTPVSKSKIDTERTSDPAIANRACVLDGEPLRRCSLEPQRIFIPARQCMVKNVC